MHRLAPLVKYFGGMLNREVAESLGIGERTVERYWFGRPRVGSAERADSGTSCKTYGVAAAAPYRSRLGCLALCTAAILAAHREAGTGSSRIQRTFFCRTQPFVLKMRLRNRPERRTVHKRTGEMKKIKKV